MSKLVVKTAKWNKEPEVAEYEMPDGSHVNFFPNNASVTVANRGGSVLFVATSVQSAEVVD